MKSLSLRIINKQFASRIVEHYHYLHKRPSSISIAFGVYPDTKPETEISGVIIFGQPGSKHIHRFVNNTKPSEVLELTRLWLRDEMPKNSESQVISMK